MSSPPEPRRQRVILLTTEQVKQTEEIDHAVEAKGVRLHHKLGPRPIGNGQFISSVGVLDAPGLARHIPFLMTLPQCDVLIHDPPEPDGEQSITVVPGSVFVPENIQRVYVPRKGANPWDVPPPPPKGDWSEDALFASVGRALTKWERFEVTFASLFASFLSPSLNSTPAEQAYGSVVAAGARIDMVTAAGEAYFLSSPNPIAESEFKEVIKLAKRFSARRNEIAHGMVAEYISPQGFAAGLALFPASYARNKHAAGKTVYEGREISRLSPKYAYTSVEVSYFAEQFVELEKPTRALWLKLYRWFEDS